MLDSATKLRTKIRDLQIELRYLESDDRAYTKGYGEDIAELENEIYALSNQLRVMERAHAL